MKHSWEFNKIFNSSKAESFVDFEEPMNQVINDVGNEMKKLKNDCFFCQERFFDAGGYDYRMVIAELSQGVQVIEFLNFID